MPPKQYNSSFEAIGTQWCIATTVPLADKVLTKIHGRIEQFDQTYSRFRADSLVSQVAKQAGTFTFPDDSVLLFNFYKQIYDISDGAVTPLIGSMLERAGYDASYSFKLLPQQTLPSWDQVLRWNKNILTTQQPVLLDVGAAGKGYLVDIIAAVLDVNGIADYIIDASGDMRHKGTISNTVGLEHPLDPTLVIGSIEIVNQSLCASASNRRVWGNNNSQHHIFDPRTQMPTREIIATWVIADTAMLTDGLATALFFVEPDKLRTTFEFEYARINSKGAIDYSQAFEGHLFL